jgi:transposase-like protein
MDSAFFIKEESMIKPWKQAQIRRVFNANQNYSKTAKECDVDPKTVHKYVDQQTASKSVEKPRRAYKTRIAAEFEAFWPEIERLLEDDNELKPYAILDHMIEIHKDSFSPTWKRTLERRVANWKIANGVGKDITFTQVHKPGDVLAIDFTDLSKLGIRIGSELMVDNFLAFHATLTYSNWEYAEHCRSESFEALASGVQNAFLSLGGVTTRVRFDSMSAAVNNLSTDYEFRSNWKSLLDHFGTQAHRINVRSPHENGDCESSHRHLKDYLDQKLRLRGSRDFEDVERWQEFLSQCIATRNKKRSMETAKDRENLAPFPKTFFPVFTTQESIVKSDCILRIKQNDYCVPSSFIDKKVHLRIYSDRIELWYAGNQKLEMPRLIGKNKVFFDFRHVIDRLIRKPSAFKGYRYREQLYPTLNFRHAFDAACAQHGERIGIRTYLRLLYLAKHVGLEQVDQELAMALSSKSPIDAKAIESKLQYTPVIPESFHDVDPQVETPDLDDYNLLLEHKEVLDEPTESEPFDRSIAQATEPLGSGWPLEEASPARDESHGLADCGASSTRELELSGIPQRVGGPRVPQADREPHSEASEKVIAGYEQSVVGHSLESITDDSATTDAAVAKRRVLVAGGESSDFWETWFWEDDVTQCAGGTTRTSGVQRVLRTMCQAGAALAACEAGTTTSADAFEAWSLLGLDHRRSWLCPTESGGDGSPLYVDCGSVREDEHPDEFEPPVFEMGADLQGSNDNGCGHRSAGSPEHDSRVERTEHSSRGSESESRETASTRPVIIHWKSEPFHSGNLVVAKVEF